LAPFKVSLFPQLKIKLRGLYFDTTEVREAESEEVLNNLTKRDVQDVFKKSERCIRVEGNYFEGDGDQ
jgi:hypothetical protein